MDGLVVVVDDVAAGGDGIGRAPDGRVVFVRGAVPGDEVAVTVERERPRSLHGAVADVVVASTDRVSAPCPHVDRGCGGCGWQHVDPEAQRRLKVRIVEESLRRLGREDVAPGSVAIGTALPATGFRTNLRCRLTPDGPAFRAARSHDEVVVDSCLVAHPGLEALLPGLPASEGIEGEVTLRIGGATGERLVRCSPGVPDALDLPDDVVVVGDDDLADGADAVFDDEVAGVRFRIGARSFFQTRTDGAGALVGAVRDALGDDHRDGRLLDLYGGVGLFSATLRGGMDVTLVESGRSSVADARHNLGPDAQVVRCPVERWRPEPADVVIADPPRAGLGADAVDRVAATGAEVVVVVSCDPASLGRDCFLLNGVGYRRAGSTLVDLFPHTPHVEVVSRFERLG